MNREISIRKFGIFMILLVGLEIVLLWFLMPKKEELEYDENYCQEAVCNSDSSLCYAYDEDQNGETIVVWRGTCKR